MEETPVKREVLEQRGIAHKRSVYASFCHFSPSRCTGLCKQERRRSYVPGVNLVRMYLDLLVIKTIVATITRQGVEGLEDHSVRKGLPVRIISIIARAEK